VKGLTDGKLGAQIIVRWTNEGKINEVVMWYKEPKSGFIETYYLYPDGSTAGAIYE
jgi:hypothetical protein